MKKIVLTALLLSISVQSYATEPNNPDKDCVIYSDLAYKIMQRRQAGAPMSEMLRIAAGDGKHPAVSQVVRAVVIDAYKQTRYSTAEVQEDTAADFRDDVLSACIELHSK